jgi:NADH:ubiquinone oxidoreductase subunit 3 (subunit A)
MDILLSPPLAFLIYVALGGALLGFGRLLAGAGHPSALKSSTYASGEAPPAGAAAPGYGPFFVIALFFAALHLGVLVLASGPLSPGAALFIGGLALALLVLILG